MKTYIHRRQSKQSIKLVGALRGMALSVATFAFAASVGILPPALQGQTAPQVLPRGLPPEVANLQPVGRLEPDKQLQLAIALPVRDQPGLEALLEQLYDPGSTNFHQWLTPEQFTERFGPTKQDYGAVVVFAQTNGLAVTYQHSNRLVLDVIGSVADIETTLHVNMLVYQHPTEDRTFYAPDADPSVDLAVPILGIEGLNNYALPKPSSMFTPLGNVQNPSPNGGSGPNGDFMGYDFRDAYLPGVTLTGSGQAVGLLEFDGYYTSDIIAYEQTNHLPNVTLVNILLDGFNTNGLVYHDEAALDIDMAISMAPGLSTIYVYEAGGDTISHWLDLLSRMAADDLAKQLACCWVWGGRDDETNFQWAVGIFEQMAAQGQSFLAASGDTDAYLTSRNWIPFPCDSQYVTSVGGTELKTTGPGGSYVSEAVWNFNYQQGCTNTTDMGSSGGVSPYYPIPAWQKGVNMSENQGSTTMRNIPDVALTADMICIFFNGQPVCGRGTSYAAPLWAGFTALVNQQAAENGLPPVGFLNPALYAIGEGANYASCFHDITVGNNTNSTNPNMFYAVSGYDLCTGWGTPNGQALINALASPGPFTPTRSMGTARYSHTATLLPNGLVLAAAGEGVSSILYSAELYNPASRTWAATGSLNDARLAHTATLLPNGLVLVAGGLGSSVSNEMEEAASGSPDLITGTVLASAELYNPITQGWVATGSMDTARCRHKATLLSNGLVLVAGGWGSANSCLTNAELYNPNTGMWTNTGSMNVARELHTATLLTNGLVLVAGGLNPGLSLTNAELYNQANGTWTATGSMNVARESHTATLLPNGLVLAAGGAGPASAELYNPASQTWTTTGSPSTVRYTHTATLLSNDVVLVAGGYGANGTALYSAELYNPASQLWVGTSSLNVARELHTATMLPNGFVLVAGGYGTSGALYSAELYTP